MRFLGSYIFLLSLAVTLVNAGAYASVAAKDLLLGSQSQNCATCHQQQTQAWLGSHHAKAMLPASAQNILAPFAGEKAKHYGQEAMFFKDKDHFKARVEYLPAASDAAKSPQAKDYTVLYTFGFTPLQQYLVETQDGHVQVLPFAWDTRSASEGGQRWMHLYPDEAIPPHDRLHWLQPLQNWNGMCADCHSDNVRRNYDVNKNTFDTSFNAVNVDCMACHDEILAGHPKPSSEKEQKKGARQMGASGLAELVPAIRWEFHADSNTAKASRINNAEAKSSKRLQQTWSMDSCFNCHSLRAPLRDGFESNKPFLDQFTPTLLNAPLYEADGQIREEVYVYGSFLQSKMHREGVNCGNCHEPHSNKLLYAGNQLCSQCHKAEVFDTPKHHQHIAGSEGALCVNCHMPSKTYMNVDERRDHSFSIPRPELSTRYGVPNACSDCHADKTSAWLEDAIKRFPQRRELSDMERSYIEVNLGLPYSALDIFKLSQSSNLPDIKRASMVAALASEHHAQALAESHLRQLSKDVSPLVRLASTRVIALKQPELQHALLMPLFSDKVASVRVAATDALLQHMYRSKTKTQLDEASQDAVDKARIANEQMAWRGEGRSNLASHYYRKGDLELAEKHYRAAIDIDPHFEGAYINLTDMYRESNTPEKAEPIYQRGLANIPNSSFLHYSYGLHLIRQQKLQQSLNYLQKARALAPSELQFVYTYLLALAESGKVDEALCKLRDAVTDFEVVDAGSAQSLQELYIGIGQKFGKTQVNCKKISSGS